jgi:hypothetical protein
MLKEFVYVVKQQLCMDKSYFQFGNIPDVILPNKEFVKNYDRILKVLKKVKKLYYEQKLENHIAESMK